ncbi:uncharacterized protein NPIL_61751 [Nephila pilipes]|uniref:Uncharacterized protein n=1 Tax=Nephila pilipes TaxID=299642 RepID=A0A8X6QPY7_NEPPI|nr:uncharacterized protein NPIL_61751 [Nephila pilipes]
MTTRIPQPPDFFFSKAIEEKNMHAKMAFQRTASLEKSFLSLETAVSDTTRTLIRNINVEWQKLEKYEELSTAKEDERISLQEQIRNLNENKNIIEKQLIGVEKRIQSLKKSNDELKRSVNNTRRQEDKVSKEYNSEKQMLDEKLTYYRGKWQERYESRYANKPLVQEYEQAKRALSDTNEQLKCIKSELHGCKAEIFKAKCERGKRNAEESGFYPLEFFIIRLASIGIEVVKLEEDENKLLKDINSLQQNIDTKLMERKTKKSISSLNKLERSKNQVMKEFYLVSGNDDLEQPLDSPIKRKGITGNLQSTPQKIIRTNEDSLLNKYIQLSKTPQDLKDQTLDKHPISESEKQVMQEIKVRNRMEKLKLYTPKFSTPSELVPKTTVRIDSDSRLLRQNNKSFAFQASYSENHNSNRELPNRITSEGNTNIESTSGKSIKTNISLNTLGNSRVNELKSETFQYNPKKKINSYSETFQKNPIMQSKNRVTVSSNILRENCEMKQQQISENTSTRKKDLLKNLDFRNVVPDKNNQQKKHMGEDNPSKISQEFFVRSNEENEHGSNLSQSATHEKINIYNDKEYRFIKKIQPTKTIKKSNATINEENWLTDETVPAKTLQDIHMNRDIAIPQMKERNSLRSNNESLIRNDLEMRLEDVVNLSDDQEIKNKLTELSENAKKPRITTHTHAKYEGRRITQDKLQNTVAEKGPRLLTNSGKTFNEMHKSQDTPRELERRCNISLVTQPLNKTSDIMDQEMEEVDINDQHGIDPDISAETKGTQSVSTYEEQEQMDIESVQETRSTLEVNLQNEANRQEMHINRYDIHQESENTNRESISHTNILIDKAEVKQSLTVSSSRVIATDKTGDQPQGKYSKIAYDQKGRDSNAILPNSCDANKKQALRSQGDDNVTMELDQNSEDNSLAKSFERSVDSKIITEESSRVETEISNNKYSLLPEEPEISPRTNFSEPEVLFHSKLGEPISSYSSIATQREAYELKNHQSSNISTSSSDLQYFTPKSTDLTKKLQPNFHSPLIEETKTPSPQVVRTDTPSPFDFEKHMKILGELKKTPNFAYENRQMFKTGNNPEETQNIPLESSKTKNDMFETMTFFDSATAENGVSPKLLENEKAKTEESGFLSFALEDYLADSPDSSEQGGKEKSMFSFQCDSPKSGVKSPGFFPLFAADTQESAKDTKSGFVFNFGGAEKAPSPDQGSFKFLF